MSITQKAAKPDIHGLVQRVELVGIQFLEVYGRLREGPQDEVDTDVKINVKESHGPNAIEVRFRVLVEHTQASYAIEVGTRYTTEEPVDLEPSVLRDFIEKVAIMAAFPFIREGVATTAAKLEVEVPIMGILRQGEFSLGELAESVHASE